MFRHSSVRPTTESAGEIGKGRERSGKAHASEESDSQEEEEPQSEEEPESERDF